MRKMLLIFLSILMLSLLFSCVGKTKSESSYDLFETIVSDTINTYTELSTETERITEETSLQIMGNYKDIQGERPFQSFMILNMSMGTEKVLLNKDDLDWLNFVEFVVLGIKDEMGPSPFLLCSSYYVKILGAFGIYEKEFNERIVGEVYNFYYYGSPENQRYARPPLEIASRYVAFFGEKGWVNYEGRFFGPSLVMAIEEREGIEYLYGRNVDLSEIRIAIRITDDEENQVYKEDRHAVQIEELKKGNIPLPSYDYKLDYLAFKELIKGLH